MMYVIVSDYAIYDIFFFNDTATTEIYTLSLHDALPILVADEHGLPEHLERHLHPPERRAHLHPLHRALHLLKHLPRDLQDRKSTRLNSSHSQISYAVFCLKKKTLLNIQYYRYTCTHTLH